MRYELIVIGDHQILRVAPDTDAMALALTQSYLKAEKVHKDSPSGRPRDPQEVLSVNYLGTLADIVCARLLESYFKKHNIKIGVVRYDDVRKDEFKNPDEYDIKLTALGRDHLVEVRSSVCQLLSLEEMIGKWHILGPYESSTKGGTETVKPFYLRPIYHLSTYEKNKKSKEYKITKAREFLHNGELKLYFVGGATSALLEEKGRNEETYELKQNKANFRVLDITNGLDAKGMLEQISLIAIGEDADNGNDETET